MMAPKMGPVPAMLRNCIMNTFHVGSGMKSTPSAHTWQGVGFVASQPNMRAT